MSKFFNQILSAWAMGSMLGAFLYCAAPVLAEPPAVSQAAAAPETSEDPRDPEALAALTRATDFLSALPRVHLRARVVHDVIQEDGRRLQFEKHGEIFLQRPDQLYAEVFLDNGRHRQFWYDGRTLGFADRLRNQHTQVKAPPTIDGMLDMLEGLLKDPMPLADLLYSDLAPLEQRATEADVVGESLVNGRACLHLAFRGETVDWQLWVEKGETPFIRKLTISYRDVPGVPQYVAWIDDWDIPESFNQERFTFAVPAGSEWVRVLVPMPRRIEEGGTP